MAGFAFKNGNNFFEIEQDFDSALRKSRSSVHLIYKKQK